MEFVLEHLVEFLFGTCTLILSAVLGIVAHKSKKKIDLAMTTAQQANEKAAEEIARKEADYQRLLEEEKTRNYRNMIIEEINPLIEEIHLIKQHIKDDEKEFEVIIEDLNQKHKDNLAKILESYKFRFIQLCKTHLKDGYITPEEWEQIVAFYDLYHGLGGNGQAEEYFNQVKKLVGKKIPE